MLTGSKTKELIDIPIEAIDIVTMGENITALTYQKFSEISYKYKGKEFMIILDEVHCLMEDATFSVYPEKLIRFLKANLDNTSRIYLTATPDAITPSCISMMTEKGVSPTLIKKIVGHSGAMSLTEKVYTHVNVQKLLEAINKI